MRSHATSVAVVVKERTSSLSTTYKEELDSELINRIKRKIQEETVESLFSNDRDVEESSEWMADEQGDETEKFTTRLGEVTSFMATSQAFAHFRERLRIFIFPLTRQYVRAILQSAKVSETEISEISCTASWEILKYCETELSNQGGQFDLFRILTITGSPENAQAMSCEEYVAKVWGVEGRHLLSVVNSALTSHRCCEKILQIESR